MPRKTVLTNSWSRTSFAPSSVARAMSKASILSDTTTKPPCPFNPEGVPADLRLGAWIGWQWRKRQGHWVKMPVDPHRFGDANAYDPANQLTFKEAVALYQEGKVDGAGVVLGEQLGGNLAGVDFDDCLDDSGQLKRHANFIASLDSYTEVSPSGTGLKTYLFGELPRCKHNNKELAMEVYDSKRWFAVTGLHWKESPACIEERQRQLEDLVDEVFSPSVGKAAISSVPPVNYNGPAPDNVVQAVRAKLADHYPANIDPADDCSSCDISFYAACECVRAGLDKEQTVEVLSQTVCADSKMTGATWTRDRLERKYEEAAKEPRDFKWTDAGNAERFAAMYGFQIHYVHAWSKYVIYRDGKWQIDDTGEAMRLALQTVRSMDCEANMIEDMAARKAMKAFAKASESAARLTAILTLARSVKPIPVKYEQLNNDPYLLNCLNGTVDLRTGELREHNRADYITKQCPVSYPTSPETPTRWLQFLNEIFAGDKELIAFVQRLIGYALIGSVIEHVLPIFHGGGANGKSTFTTTLLEILGDYGISLGQNYLMRRKFDAHETEVTDLYSIRLAVASETEEGARLDEARIKNQTGGGNIRGRRLYEDSWQFTPSHTFILETNHRPRIAGTDHAIWRRVLLIPFNVKFANDQQDPHLLEKLRAEHPGILHWFVQGSLSWQLYGLNPPDKVRAATAEYQQDSDLLGQFLEECCIISPDKSIRCSELYERYANRARQRGEIPLAQKRVGERLKDKFDKRRNSQGQYIYIGITLNDQANFSDAPEFELEGF